MNEASLFEKIGRQQVKLEEQDAAYTALLQLLAQVVKGDTDRSRVLVNLTDRTWAVAPDGLRPETPGTINGLPVCVVAPAAEERAPVPGAEPT